MAYYRPIKANATIGEKYNPILDISRQDYADEYFERCVQHTMSYGKTREEAEKIERQNIGYYAGYFSSEVAERVNRLFRTSHPIFGGNMDMAPERAFALGREAGRLVKRRQESQMDNDKNI